MRFKEVVIILISVAFVASAMYLIQVSLPKKMKDGEACYSVYLGK